MLSPSVACLLLALYSASLSAASPIVAKSVAPEVANEGIVIPLFKRSDNPITDEDGLVDWRAAQVHRL